MSVEFLKSIFDWAAVVLVGLTFIAGAGALITGKILSIRQAEQLREFSSDLTAARLELGKQQERTAKAEGTIASAEQQAAEANAKAEKFRLGIAKAEADAAEANKKTEEERLARVRIEEKLGAGSSTLVRNKGSSTRSKHTKTHLSTWEPTLPRWRSWK